MSLDQSMHTGRRMPLERRMTLIAAVAVVFTSTVIFPLFSGTTWFFAGIGAVITVSAFGALSRIRTLPVVVCLLISLAGLLLYLNLAFEAPLSWIGIIPTPTSVTALGHLVKTGMDEASRYAPGAPNVKGLVLLATGGIGITAVFTDLIAVRLRSTALAGLPLLVLFTVPVTMSAGRSPVATIVIFCLGTGGYLAMLSADGRERIRVWGRLVSLWRTHEDPDAERHGSVGTDSARPGRPAYRGLRGPDTTALAVAGRRVGLASIVLALCAPLLIPGLHASKLLSSDWGFGTGNGGGTVLLPDPLSSTASQLRETRPKTVLTYQTNASAFLQAFYPQYLQQYVYDRLTDSTSSPWQLFSTNTRTQGIGATLPPEEGLNSARAPETTTLITAAPGPGNNGGVSFLPVPYPPVKLSGVKGTWQVDPHTLMLVSKDSSAAGQSYKVVSRDVDPTDADLRHVPATPSRGADNQLPADYQQQALRKLAQQHTAGAKTQFDKAHALETWLRGPDFNYNLYAPQISSSATLLQFLTSKRTGDCVQFSFAFTVLARLLGIPTRLATGYTQGVETTANHYVVKNADAHAWPEVFFAGYGWVRFEPTPQGQGSAQPDGYSQPPGTSLTPPTLPNSGANAIPSQGVGQGGKVKSISNLGNSTGGSTGAKKSAGTPWTAVLLAVLAAIALAIGVITIAAPSAVRVLSSRPESTRPRSRLGLGAVVLGVVVAGVVALALYRLLSRTSGLDLKTGWATVGIAFGAAAAFVLAVPTVFRILLRRWRWMRAEDDASRAHAAWYELQADLADFGVGYLPSDSPRALAGRVTSTLTLPDSAVEAVSRIALAEERATYAARPGPADTLRQDGAAARRGIAAASGHGARWRSWIFPASVMSVLTDTSVRATESWTTRTRLRRKSDHIPG